MVVVWATDSSQLCVEQGKNNPCRADESFQVKSSTIGCLARSPVTQGFRVFTSTCSHFHCPHPAAIIFYKSTIRQKFHFTEFRTTRGHHDIQTRWQHVTDKSTRASETLRERQRRHTASSTIPLSYRESWTGCAAPLSCRPPCRENSARRQTTVTCTF